MTTLLEAISPTAKKLLTDPPHPEIELVAGQVLDAYQRQRRYLAGKDTAYLLDLVHACEEVAHDKKFSVRVGAEVNRAAAAVLLEKRGVR
jgi:hypothetical protein